MTIVVVIGSDRSIGRNGDLIRHLPEDLRHFKAITLGGAVIMGRRTWESLPKRPLPGRLNIVISRSPQTRDAICKSGFQPTVAVASSLWEAISLAEQAGYPSDKIFVLGGGEVYRQALPLASRLELTVVDEPCPDADTFFPEIPSDEWKCVEKTPGNPRPQDPPYHFMRCERS